MFFSKLPPVGNPVTRERSKKLNELSVFSSYQVHFYASGTAALAAALLAAIAEVNSETGSTVIRRTEVILPAYACPDLVSAVVFTGATPVLVDLQAESPWMDLAALSSAITEHTVAIVAVDLFGIRERWQQLRAIAEQHDLLLIEDSAQYFPGAEESIDWHGDMVILSFGRGKPVSLLGGGAVLTKNAGLYERLPKPAPVPANGLKRWQYGLKTGAYNAMISPILYWILLALPFLHLGETRYHPLSAIAAMDQVRLDLLASNIFRYQNDAAAAARRDKISAMLDTIDFVVNLPEINDTPVKTRLLRYPLLVGGTSRDRVYRKLERAGLGASIMYPASLPMIAGVEQLLGDSQRYPNAEAFAARLITLPLHSSVSDKKIAQMKAVIGSV